MDAIKAIAGKLAGAMGPALKKAFMDLDPKAELRHSLKVYSKDSRFHVEAGAVVDASINLPGDLDDAASGAVNATGIVGLGNSQPASTPDGDSPSN